MRTLYDLQIAVSDGEQYGLPAGQRKSWGSIVPANHTGQWKVLPTIKAGAEVTNVESLGGLRIRCTVAGHRLVTAKWACE